MLQQLTGADINTADRQILLAIRQISGRELRGHPVLDVGVVADEPIEASAKRQIRAAAPAWKWRRWRTPGVTVDGAVPR